MTRRQLLASLIGAPIAAKAVMAANPAENVQPVVEYRAMRRIEVGDTMTHCGRIIGHAMEACAPGAIVPVALTYTWDSVAKIEYGRFSRD